MSFKNRIFHLCDALRDDVMLLDFLQHILIMPSIRLQKQTCKLDIFRTEYSQFVSVFFIELLNILVYIISLALNFITNSINFVRTFPPMQQHSLDECEPNRKKKSKHF